MNNNQQGGQPSQQPAGGMNNAQQQAQNRKPHLYRPEQMRQLPPSFPDEDKLKWEQGLRYVHWSSQHDITFTHSYRSLWSQIEKNDQQSQAHNEAKVAYYCYIILVHHLT